MHPLEQKPPAMLRDHQKPTTSYMWASRDTNGLGKKVGKLDLVHRVYLYTSLASTTHIREGTQYTTL